MDLESYIARYSGETRLQRLLLIAQRTSDEAIAAQAFTLAEAQMKQDGNVRRYKEVFGYTSSTAAATRYTASDTSMEQQESSSSEAAAEQRIRRRRPPPSSMVMDEAWIHATEKSNREARHVLQGRLSTSQSHLQKEAIRNAYVALAQHDGKTGELREASASLFRAMDYCTSRSQTAQISLLVLELAFATESYQQAREHVTKVEHTMSNTSGMSSSSPPTPTAAASPSNAVNPLQDISIKLKVASGMERMAQGDYSTAADIFTTLCMTNSAAKIEWPGVTCAEDVAMYAALLSLATQSRDQILELAEHPEALELAPAMKDLLSQWSRANYVKCMQAFSEDTTSSSTSMILPFPDLYLSVGDKWEKLCQKIREKCLLEYLRPYQRVQLSTMEQLFPSVPNLQDTLVDLMGRGLLMNAKIDARANVLYKIPQKQESVNLLSMEKRVLDDTHAMLIRLACMEHDLSVQDGFGGHSSGGRGRRGGNRFAREGGTIDIDDDDSSDEDTPMMDVDTSAARNPEDLY